MHKQKQKWTKNATNDNQSVGPLNRLLLRFFFCSSMQSLQSIKDGATGRTGTLGRPGKELKPTRGRKSDGRQDTKVRAEKDRNSIPLHEVS